MRKILTALMVLLSISVLGAVSLSLGDGNMDGVSLYAPDGTMADVSEGIQDSGYLIQSQADGKVFTSPFGEIHLNAGSVVAVTDFTLPSPSLYIMEGNVSIVLTEDIELEVYTPTTLTLLPGKGEYVFTTNAETEGFLNLSGHSVTTYDAVTASETKILSMNGVSRTESSLPFTISEEEYKEISVVSIPAEPEPVVEEPVEIAPEYITYKLAGYELTFVVADGYVDLLYPSIVTESDAASFFAYEVEKYGSMLDGITYSFIDGGARINLPASVDRATAKSYVQPMFQDITAYVMMISTPEKTEPIAEPKPIAEEPVEIAPEYITYKLAGYELTFVVADGYVDLLYPSIVTESDAASFFAYEAEKYGSMLDGITYSFIDSGARINLPQSVDRATAKSYVQPMFQDITAYVMMLSAPEKAEVPSAPVMKEPVAEIAEEPEAMPAETFTMIYGGYVLTVAIGDGYADLFYPSIVTENDVKCFFAYERAKYGSAVDGITYTLFDGGARLTLPQSVDRDIAEANVPFLFEDIKEYAGMLSAPAAEPEIAEIAPEYITYKLAGYELTFVVADGYVDLLYPSIVTESDAASFFAYEVEKYGSMLDGITYSFIDGGARINLPQSVDRATAKSYVQPMFQDITAYVMMLSAPEKTEPEPALVDSYVFNYDGYDLVISIGDGYADILYPSIVTESDAEGFFAYEMAKYGSAVDGITYSFIDGGARLDLPQSVDRETAKANAPVLFADVVEYIGSFSTPSAPGEGISSEPVVAAEEGKGEGTGTAPVISGEIRDKFAFDINLLGRAYTDSQGNTSIRASIQPVFTSGSFRAAFNIDPVHLQSAWNDTERDTFGWIGFALDFIDEIRYRSIDESVLFTIDRYTTLSGDTLGIYSGLMHGWDGEHQALSFNHEYRTGYYSHRLWFDDLSMTRTRTVNGIEEGWSTAGLSLAFSVSRSYPLTFRFEALADISHKDITQSVLYPEFSVDIPFVSRGTSYIGLRAGFATMLSGDYTANPLAENGYLVSLTLPLRFGGFTAELGAAYSTGMLHYGNAGSDFLNVPAGDYITVIGKAGYDGKWFGIDFRTWFDISTDTVSFVSGNGYADITAYVDLWGVRIYGGFRARDVLEFSKYDVNSGFFAGIASDAGPVSAYIQASYIDEAWSLTTGASVSAFGRGKDRTEGYTNSLPVRFSLETGFNNAFSSAYTPEILVMPVITVGSGLTEAAFRAPIKMAFNESGSLYLAGMNGRKLWDFGTSDESNKIYRAITDTFALIDHITLGDGHETIAYLLAERGYRKDGTLFSSYGWNDALSLRLGFNFPNLAIGIYADNLEAPHISEFSIGFYPIDLDSLSFSINIPMEMLFASSETYTLLMYPEFRIDIPFYGFELSAFIMGEMGTSYRDGIATETRLIYDFQNGTFYDYLIGAELKYTGNGMTTSIESGYRSGKIGPDLFNEFVARNGRIISDMTDVSDPGWYIKAAYDLDFGYLDFGISYSIDNVIAACSNGSYSDTLSVSLGGMVSNNARLYGKFAREGFTTSFGNGESFADYMLSPDTAFALGADFTFGIVGFTAELRTTFQADSYQSYINVLTLTDNPALELSVRARVMF